MLILDSSSINVTLVKSDMDYYMVIFHIFTTPKIKGEGNTKAF